MTNNKDNNQITDLKSIGRILKKKREEHTYTLEHVSEITRITLTSLRNIEDGNLGDLPGLVFVRGFIRNYAKLLGIESDWMIEALNQTYNLNGEKKSPQSLTDDSASTLKKSTESKSKFMLFGITGVVLLAIVVAFWNMQPFSDLDENRDKVETVQAIDTEDSIETVNPSLEAAKENSEINVQTVNAVISPLTLVLLAKEDQWIRLAIDGQEAFELKLKKEEKYDWPAEEEYVLTMTTGNSASIHLNGEEIIDRENFSNQLYKVKLNKFTLKQINNR